MSRRRTLVSLAAAQLRYHRRRTILAVVGVALAVLLVVLVVGLGYGLFTTGGEAISWLSRDLWVSGGGLGLAPGTVGTIENPIEDSHRVVADIERDDRVAAAQPLAFKTVYVSPNTSEFTTLVGVGAVPSNDRDAVGPASVALNDSHYANGSYDGPMTREIVIDSGTADRFGVGVNDTLYVGGTIGTARTNRFRIVAVSGRYSTFLGTGTVGMPLSELQEVTGSTGTDRASLIGVTLAPGASAATVERDIERRHPEVTVRGNDAQVRSIVGGQASVVVGTVALVVLAVVSGVVLVVNVLATLVRGQRTELAALKAAGVSGRSLAGMVVVQGAVIGAVGGAVGIVLAPLAVGGLNALLADLSGFAKLVKTPPWVFAAGWGLATTMGVVGSTVAGRTVAKLSPLAHLRE